MFGRQKSLKFSVYRSCKDGGELEEGQLRSAYRAIDCYLEDTMGLCEDNGRGRFYAEDGCEARLEPYSRDGVNVRIKGKKREVERLSGNLETMLRLQWYYINDFIVK